MNETPNDECTCPQPEARCPAHFRIARGWGMRATASERGRAHLAMAQVTSGDQEPGIFSFAEIRDAAATALRRHGVSVEYALREQALMKQVKAAKSIGAEWVLTLHDPHDANAAAPYSWTPEPPPEWDRLLSDIDLSHS